MIDVKKALNALYGVNSINFRELAESIGYVDTDSVNDDRYENAVRKLCYSAVSYKLGYNDGARDALSHLLRCRDCSEYERFNNCGWCWYFCKCVDDDDYCSRGTPKEPEE